MKPKKDYKTGDNTIDALINQLATLCSSAETEQLLSEMFTTAVKLGKETKDRGDLKLINSSLKELRYASKVFAPYRNAKKVIIYGSARSSKSSAEYIMAQEFARKITEKDYMVITGGGPGVMEAGNKGACAGKEFALNIQLPFEQSANPYIDEKDKIINFKYFFTRKLTFVKESDATVLFPGGFGTNDECFEMLTLAQTGKSKPRPIILMEPEGSTYWESWHHFVIKELVEKGFINETDLNLYRIARTVDEAISCIDNFYRVYHSIRYVKESTVLRLNQEISDKKLGTLNNQFNDILASGTIERSAPTAKEIQEKEYLELPRLVMHFNRRGYGRLWKLIQTINQED